METATNSMTVDELAAFGQAARALLEVDSGDSRNSDLYWRSKAFASLVGDAGWFDLGEVGAVDALLVLSEQLGRAACSFSVVDHFIAAQAVLPGFLPGPDFAPVLTSTDPQAPRLCLDAPDTTTHILWIDSDDGRIVLMPVMSGVGVEGFPEPPWQRFVVGAPAVTNMVGGPETTRLLAIWVSSLTARIVGSSQRCVELSTAHAIERHAFGRPIGRFQAVSHRVVDQARAVSGMRVLAADSLERHQSRDPAWVASVVLAAELAVESAPDTAIAAMHTLAAHGYFDEHELPRLFRQIHADVATLRQLLRGLPSTAMGLMAGQRLPAPAEPEDATTFRAAVRATLERHHNGGSKLGAEGDPALVDDLARAGHLTWAWPDETDDRDRPRRHLIVSEELGRAGLHLHAKTAADICGPLILRHGTQAQRDRWLPRLRTGQLSFYLGYSEPEAGSDLAGLRTKAEPDGSDWVVTGQKAWGTGAHKAEYVLLAARTSSDMSQRHEGITLFLTPVRGRTGWSSQEHRALSGEVSSTTFFDGLRVPDADRIGPVGRGWQILTEALTHERVLMASRTSSMLEIFRLVIAELGESDRDSPTATAFIRLAAPLQAAHLMSLRAALASAEGRSSGPDLALAKITSGLLYEELCRRGIDALGPTSLVDGGAGNLGPLGALHYHLRLSIMYVVGGGTVDIQKNIAARALGLGTSRRIEELKS